MSRLPHSAMRVSGGVLSKSGVTTDLAATGRSASKPKSRGWSYREPDPLYGDFTTEAWRRLYVYRIERPCGNDLYRTNGREIGDEAAFQTFLHDYKATVFPGRSPRQLVVWCYRPAERPLSQEQWDALDALIADCRIYNVPQPVKILYDDLRHERIVCYVPPTLHIH